MKRRSFIGTAVGSAALSHGITGCAEREKNLDRVANTGEASVTNSGKLDGMTLEEVKMQYEYDLFDDFITFHDKYVIDHQYGSFMANTDHDGSHADTNTSSSFMGRGIWHIKR